MINDAQFETEVFWTYWQLQHQAKAMLSVTYSILEISCLTFMLFHNQIVLPR